MLKRFSIVLMYYKEENFCGNADKRDRCGFLWPTSDARPKRRPTPEKNLFNVYIIIIIIYVLLLRCSRWEGGRSDIWYDCSLRVATRARKVVRVLALLIRVGYIHTSGSDNFVNRHGLLAFERGAVWPRPKALRAKTVRSGRGGVILRPCCRSHVSRLANGRSKYLREVF